MVIGGTVVDTIGISMWWVGAEMKVGWGGGKVENKG